MKIIDAFKKKKIEWWYEYVALNMNECVRWLWEWMHNKEIEWKYEYAALNMNECVRLLWEWMHAWEIEWEYEYVTLNMNECVMWLWECINKAGGEWINLAGYVGLLPFIQKFEMQGSNLFSLERGPGGGGGIV